jgi:hypothetical protein
MIFSYLLERLKGDAVFVEPARRRDVFEPELLRGFACEAKLGVVEVISTELPYDATVWIRKSQDSCVYIAEPSWVNGVEMGGTTSYADSSFCW